MGCFFTVPAVESEPLEGRQNAREPLGKGAAAGPRPADALEQAPLASAAPCMHGCGLAAFGTHPTCCTRCRGPEGPHAHDCFFTNERLRPACHRDCGRPCRKGFTTCCCRCPGHEGSHSAGCAEACHLAVLPPPADTAASGSWQALCGGCGSPFSVAAEPSALPGMLFRACCPRCSGNVALRAPGVRPRAAVEGGKPEGRRRALLVGVNYLGSDDELQHCLQDAADLHRLLTETLGWPATAVRMLGDDRLKALPTKRNIEAGLRWLTHGAQPGDVLFFSFSGHGSQAKDPYGYTKDGVSEMILPVDYEHAGSLSADHLADLLVKPLPDGARLTALMDCCHVSAGLDLPFAHTSRGWQEEANPYHSPGDVQLFSGRWDASSGLQTGRACMTAAFCEVLRSRVSLKYAELLQALAKAMRRRDATQRPRLTSTQRFALDRRFGLEDAVGNGNARLGRCFHERRSRRALPKVDSEAGVVERALRKMGYSMYRICCCGLVLRYTA